VGETANIAAISEKISGTIFQVFGWQQYGPVNFNFREDSALGEKAKQKRPCDVIFGYQDPFLNDEVFLITDLKSYAKSTAKDAEKLKKAISNLGNAHRAANNSDDFQGHLPVEGASLSSLLFIFNHDQEYDKDFGTALAENHPSPLDIPTKSNLYVFGPPQIQFFLDIYNDLQKIYGEETMLKGKFRYFYPNLISAFPTRNYWHSATPELLLSPYIPIIYDIDEKVESNGTTQVKSKKCVNFYYSGKGETPEEFCFILDYMFRYNLIDDITQIRIKIPHCGANFMTNFDRAKRDFSRHFYSQDSAFEKIKQIEVTGIPRGRYQYHENAIGMEKRKDFKNVTD
jgi:hypothetical protein